MKKSKFMVGVLVASIALLGTGYAYWTDQLTLNSTVETGRLNVIYTAAPTLAKGELQQGKGGELICGKEAHTHNANPFSKDYCFKHGPQKCRKEEHQHGPECYSSASDKTLENQGYIIINPTGTQTGEKEIAFGIANMYPGSSATATFTAENNGTIPAVIDYVEVTEGLTDADKAFLGILDVELTGSYLDKDGVAQTLEAKTGKLIDLASVMSEFYGNTRLETGKTITTTIKVTFAGNAASGDDYEQNGSTITVKTNWIQHNALNTEAEAK